MGSIQRVYGAATANPVAPNNSILASHINTDLDTVFATLNGNIEDANIKSGANIAISKTALGTYTSPTAWTPTFTGFTASVPTGVGWYMQIGKLGVVSWMTSAAGTSNATSLTITNFPLTPNADIRTLCSRSMDAGAYQNTPAMAKVAAGATTINIYKYMDGETAATLWTNSGSKFVDFLMVFQVA